MTILTVKITAKNEYLNTSTDDLKPGVTRTTSLVGDIIGYQTDSEGVGSSEPLGSINIHTEDVPGMSGIALGAIVKLTVTVPAE